LTAAVKGLRERRATATSRHKKNSFATGLLVEHSISLVRLLKLPAVRKQMIDLNLAIRNGNA
jgi:hypothetical protein